MNAHTFEYSDAPDFVRQMCEMIEKLRSGKEAMTPYHVIRARYPHLGGSAFTQRLKRFKGRFPHQRGSAGRKITHLLVTQELDEYLRK